MNLDNNIAIFVFSVTTLAFGLAMAFLVKDILLRLAGIISHLFTRYLTTSIEIQSSRGYGSNVTSWLINSIEHHCGERLGHFGCTKDVINLKKDRLHRLDYLLHDHNENLIDGKDESLEDANTVDIRKQLDPLQTSKSVFFFYKQTCIRVTRNVIPELKAQHQPNEIYKVTAYGTRNKQILIEMLEEARKRLEKKPSKHVNYFKASHVMRHSSWRLAKRFQPRTLSSIVLKDGITDVIQKDLEEFIESRKWYKERGIPYRRGYLLYGPPGCGKTSFVKAISGQIGYDIFELQLSNSQVNDEGLNELMSSISRNSILLLEDIDAVFLPRLQDEAKSETNDGLYGKLRIRESRGGLSFSGLLNAIDGIAAEEDYIIFMTTNSIEMLDSALIRPGRIDMRQLIDYPDQQQIVSFFKKFYPGCKDDVAESFGKAVTNLKCNPSVAQLQGVFLNHKHTPEDNIRDVDTLIDVCKSNVDLGVRNIYL